MEALSMENIMLLLKRKDLKEYDELEIFLGI